jgi:hypothetical protein
LGAPRYHNLHWKPKKSKIQATPIKRKPLKFPSIYIDSSNKTTPLTQLHFPVVQSPNKKKIVFHLKDKYKMKYIAHSEKNYIYLFFIFFFSAKPRKKVC